MKKILLALLCLPSIALAAQQEITAVPDSPVLPSIGSLKDAVNLRLADIDENFDEIYPIIEAGSVYVNASAPADTKVVWIDTDQDNAIKVNISGTWTVVGTAGGGNPSGSATYPSAAGVANWNGSAWGTSYTVGTAANNLVQLNASAQLPAVSAALLTNFPTLNQNTTGTAGGLSGQYIDWSASSGGTSIANKPTLGTVAALDYGADIGDVVRLGDDGDGNASLPFTISYTDLTDKPTIPADVGDLTDTGGLLGGSVDSLDDLSDVTLGTPSSGQVLKFNGSVWAAAADSTAEGAGYVSTPPTYSDEACTAGQYAFSTTTGYVCVSSGDWNTFSLTDWNNPTPDTTPAAFSFVDQTDVDTSTEITSALVQIIGINAATAVTASGGTAAICTSSDIGDCGTFGTSPGNITNNQYVAARHTSSASYETAVNTVVTVGGVSDTFTSTTAAEVAGPTPTFYFNADSATSGQSPTIGSGTITIGASVSSVAGQVGNALSSTAGWSGGQITTTTSGNINTSTGTMGFWLYYSGNTAGYMAISTSAPYFMLINEGSSLRFRYMSGYQSLAGLTSSAWNYIEIAWNYSTGAQSYRVNGAASWTEATGRTGDAPTGANIYWGPNDGNNNASRYDQIVISSVYQDDLYSTRNNTSF